MGNRLFNWENEKSNTPARFSKIRKYTICQQ